MRKTVSALISIAFLGLGGCSRLLDSLDIADVVASSQSGTLVSATKSESRVYDGAFPIFKITPETLSLTISEIPSGKSVYVARVNPTSTEIGASGQRYVILPASTGYRAAAESEFKALDGAEIPRTRPMHFVAPEISLDDVRGGARNSQAYSGLQRAVAISRKIGEQKSVFVDNDVDLSSYTSKTATLRAAGTYCNVWVVDEYYTDGAAGGAKVSSSIAENIKDKFDRFYPVVRNIYGKECDNLIYSYSKESTLKAAGASYPLSKYSDTGTIVNIVLYDIGADSALPANERSGVVGYFHSKDYYSRAESAASSIRYSNQGKYFYVDSAYSVSDFEAVISTLAHEFQHMVNFGVKNVEKGLKGTEIDTAYNEMLSMLCEDMMSEFLGLSDDRNVRSMRLPAFNTAYFVSGIREYLGAYSALSYSTSYGFGSWICRQYGGAALVKKIMANSFGGNKSLVAAVNALHSESFTFDDLFEQFLLALTGSRVYTHNQDAAQTEQYTADDEAYKYPMTAIDLWSEAYSYPTESNYFLVQNQLDAAYNKRESLFSGPFLFANNYAAPLRPEYGVTLHKLGETSAGEIKLTFSSSGSDGLIMYVIVQ